LQSTTANANANSNIWKAKLRCLLTGLQAKTNCYWHSQFAKAPDENVLEQLKNAGNPWSTQNARERELYHRQSKVICGSLFTFGFYFLAVLVLRIPGTIEDSDGQQIEVRSKHVAHALLLNPQVQKLQPAKAACKMTWQWTLAQRIFGNSNQDETTFKLGIFAWLHSKQQSSSNRGAFLLFAYSSSKLKNKLIMRSCHWRQLQPHWKEENGGGKVGEKRHWDTVRDLENSCWAFLRALYIYISMHFISDSSPSPWPRPSTSPFFFSFSLQLQPTPLALKFNCIFFNNSSTKWKFMQTLADKNGIPKPFPFAPQKGKGGMRLRMARGI